MDPRFQNLNSQLAEWQSLQPLKREDNDRLWRKLRLDWNYHSNHIEGNTLTYGETEILLIHGQATGDHGLREYEEMKAHDVAIEHMKQLVEEDRPLTEADIRDFNRILLKESFWKDAITPDGQPSRIEILPGEYKKQPNNVRTASGDIFRFADPSEVPIQMNELIQWLRAALEKKELHPIEIASKLHHDFVLIHPFGDGNGRTARILVNYVLMRVGYLPLIVPTEQKDRYLAALRRADAGELDALTDYMAACLATSMDRGVLAAKGESIEEADDLTKEIELFKRRQKGNERKVVPKSNQSLAVLCETNLKPLLADFVALIGSLDDLFAEKKVTVWIYKPGAEIPMSLDRWLQQGAMNEADSVEFRYELMGFTGDSPKPFNAVSRVRILLKDFGYEVEVGTKPGEPRNYGVPLSDIERKKVLRPALEAVFAQIQKQSGQE